MTSADFLIVITYGLALIGAGILLSSIFSIFSILGRRKKIKDKIAILPIQDLPPVTIVRPMCGLDSKLKDCLESSFKINYPKTQIILAVESEDDPSVKIAKILIKKYPTKDVQIVFTAGTKGMNPKVANLCGAFKKAKHDLVWVYDTNCILDTNSLLSALNIINDNPDVGIVHHIPSGKPSKGFISNTEAIYLSVTHTRLYLLANFFLDMAGMFGYPGSCITGKSCVYNQKRLFSLISEKELASYISEDHKMGQAMAENGYRNIIANGFAQQLLENYTLSEFCSRKIRWGRIRFYTVPASVVIEPLFQSTVAALFLSIGSSIYFGLSFPLLLSALVISWIFLDFVLFCIVSNELQNLPMFIGSWIFLEVSFFPLYFGRIFSNKVSWRGKYHKLTWNGKILSDNPNEWQDDVSLDSYQQNSTRPSQCIYKHEKNLAFPPPGEAALA